MSSNIELVTHFITQFLGKGDLAAADKTLHADVSAITGLKPDGPIEGRDAYKAIVSCFVKAFPAIEPLRIVDQFESADGSRVVTRFQSPQRHAQDYFGIAATGRSILFDETHVTRVADGAIVENIVSATNLEFEMLMAPVLAPIILKSE